MLGELRGFEQKGPHKNLRFANGGEQTFSPVYFLLRKDEPVRESVHVAVGCGEDGSRKGRRVASREGTAGRGGGWLVSEPAPPPRQDESREEGERGDGKGRLIQSSVEAAI